MMRIIFMQIHNSKIREKFFKWGVKARGRARKIRTRLFVIIFKKGVT